MNHHRLTVGRQVADEHRATPVLLDTMEFAAMRAQAGDGRRLCLDVVFAIGFFDGQHLQPWQVEDVSRHYLRQQPTDRELFPNRSAQPAMTNRQAGRI